jgi:hypothetical protein
VNAIDYELIVLEKRERERERESGKMMVHLL